MHTVRRIVQRTTSAIAALALLAGCELITGNEARWTRHLGASPVLALPDAATLHAGVPFTVDVSTQGDSGCTRAGDVQVRYRDDGTVAEITPFDEWVTGGNAACTAGPETHTRSVTLQLATAGPKILRLIGSTSDGSTTVSEYGIVVLP